MRRKPAAFLYDMLDCCRFLVELTGSESIDRYKSDRTFRSAIERELSIVGEAMLQLDAVEPALASSFTEHDRIIGFRHVLVHGYFDLNTELVWLVLKEKLPILLSELEAAIQSFPKP